jgi:hypothetical protein
MQSNIFQKLLSTKEKRRGDDQDSRRFFAG